MVRTQCFHSRGHGFDPWCGREDLEDLACRSGVAMRKKKGAVTNGNKTNEEQKFEGDFVLYTFYIISGI